MVCVGSDVAPHTSEALWLGKTLVSSGGVIISGATETCDRNN